MINETAASALSGSGNVASGYRHRDKQLVPGELLILPNTRLKWYDLALPETPVPTDIRHLARDYLQHRADKLALFGDLGFVVLHRCGADFYFLLLSTWRNENELWETVFAKPDAQHAGFDLFPLPGPHRGTYCVWELGAVWHEQQAWKRYLLSARDDRARQTYLDDRATGAV